MMFFSDRYSKYELDVLEFLRKENKVIVYGHLSIKNLVDNDLVKNAHTICSFTYNDGTVELQEFVVVLTENGKEFIKNWIDPENTELTYE